MTSIFERTSSPRPGFWKAPFTADMIAQEASVGDGLLSPDGTQIAYLRDYNQRAELWVMPSDGGHARLATADMPTTRASQNAPFTGGLGGGFRWTPDSAALLYTSSRDGKIYRVAANGGRAERITDGRGSHLGPKLTRDGSFLVYTVDRGDIDDQIFVGLSDMGAAMPTLRRLTPAGVVGIDPQICPGARRVACVLYPPHTRWAHDAQVAIIELESGDISVMTPTNNIINVAPRWSPDGDRLAFLSDRSGYLNLWMTSLDGSDPVALVPEEYEQTELVWSPDGRQIAYLRNERADVQIMVIDVTSGEARRISTRPGVHSSLSWMRDGTGVCCVHQSPSQAPEVVLYALNVGTPRQLTFSAPGGLTDPELFVTPEHVSWNSTDGLEVHGLLLTPRQVVPGGHPVLVHIHGGPTSQFVMGWDPMAQYFVARGWAMIKPNYRGSMGYGRAYADRLHGAWGEGDLQDNVTSVNVLRERNLVDEQRIVAWGSSAGGYATLACMTMAPGKFAAGVALAGISDMVALHYDSDRYGRYLPDSELGPITEAYDLWVERSPITHAAKMESPLLILVGTADRRTPPSQYTAMVKALKAADKVVEEHTYEGEGHGLRKCASIHDYITRMEDFLTRHVLERGAAS